MIPLVPAAEVLTRLACPLCHGSVALAQCGLVTCRDCATTFPQPHPGILTLIPPPPFDSGGESWRRRQDDMTAAYHELISDPDHTRRAYENDLGPFRRRLSDLDGPLLDLGGGNGLLRHFLRSGIDYVSVDPDTSWLDDRWLEVADTFSCLREPLSFVKGHGEALPFSDARFRAVVSCWSLNHTAYPARVIAEAARVLEPGGTLFVILDDVAPRWLDILIGTYRDPQQRTTADLLKGRAKAIVDGWPTQPDHLPISERDLRRHLRALTIEGRGFVGSYLWVSARR